MKFVQIIDFRTDQIEEIQKLEDEWRAATEGKRSAGRSMVAEDRDNPGRYLVIVEFPSYEAAMQNNELPETHEFAEKQMALANGAPTFYNLNVIEEHDD